MSISNPNLPKSILAFRVYTAQMFFHDLLAGVTVGLVALPLAMAFGIASGVTPQAGLYTAVVAGFLISALGGSRTQIGGPTGAFVVIVAGIVAHFGMSGLAMVTVMAGIILLVMGFTGLGAAVRFIPRMVVIGFTNGIAILIASTQIKDFFGLRTPAVPSEFLPRMKVLAAHFATRQSLRALARPWHARHPPHPAAPHPPRSRFYRRRLRLYRGQRRCFICPSRPSAAGSAAFRAAFRPLPFPTSTPSTFCPSSLQPSPWPCWQRLKACSLPSWPTA